MNKENFKTHYSNNDVINNKSKYENIEANEESIKFEFEGISNKNSEAKYHKNLKLREKLPKKSDREHSTPSRINIEIGDK